jgi:hypothetical protein
VHPQPQLVEQSVLQQQARQDPEAVLDDVLAGSLLDPRDLGGDVAVDDPGVVPLRILQLVDTTYLGIALMWSEMGSPERVGQTGAKPS